MAVFVAVVMTMVVWSTLLPFWAAMERVLHVRRHRLP